jgi:hypothetical protein
MGEGERIGRRRICVAAEDRLHHSFATFRGEQDVDEFADAVQ